MDAALYSSRGLGVSVRVQENNDKRAAEKGAPVGGGVRPPVSACIHLVHTEKRAVDACTWTPRWEWVHPPPPIFVVVVSWVEVEPPVALTAGSRCVLL